MIIAPRALRLGFVLGVASSLVACTAADAPRAASRPAPNDHAETVLSALRSNEAARPAAPALASAPRGYDVIAYDVRGAFDFDAATLRATVAIDLRLDDPIRASLTLDSKVAKIEQVSVAGLALPFAIDDGAGLLTIDLTPLGARRGRDLTLTIAYEARVSEGLTVSSGTNSDPITSRVAFTHGEPMLGPYWMPGNHLPSDRARFAIAMEVGPGEDLIANGRRVGETPTAGGRKIVRYATDFTIPAYVMAFAVGELVHEDERAPGETPLSQWHRRGVSIATRTRLRELRSMLRTYERLLGPFPFETYSLVYLPEEAGMENASITFLSETAGQAKDDYLTAHETAHQWFGDLVTIDGWEDVWIKEGMATLLTWEATRSERDFEGRGRLFGGMHGFASGEAIRERRPVPPFEHYNTGSYQRAAWLMTQLRARLGEQTFWAIVQRFLRAHAYESVTTDTFIGAFTPYFDAPTAAKIVAALDARIEPSVTVEPHEADGKQTLLWSVTDPASVLIAPIELSSIDARGKATVFALTADAPVALPIEPGGYIAIDERDVHPDLRWQMSLDPEVYDSAIAPHLAPSAPPARAPFFSRSASAQESALTAAPISTTPLGFFFDHARLDSSAAQLLSLRAGCVALRDADPDARARWSTAISPALLTSSATFDETLGLPECGVDLPSRLYGAELARLTARFDVESSDRISTLLSFDYGDTRTFDALSRLVAPPSSATMRDQAIRRLAAQVDPKGGYSPISAREVPRWSALFRDELQKTTTFWRLVDTFQGSRGLGDMTALPILAAKLQTIAIFGTRATKLICGASVLAQRRAGAWEEFKAALPPASTFTWDVRSILEDPSRCPPWDL